MLTSGTPLGPYTILGSLGAGGMGEVYRARDTRLGRDVAVKVLSSEFSASPELSARFAREARTLSQLNHPYICTLHDVGHEGGIDFLVMELIEGETLATRLSRGPLPVAELLDFATQMVGALAQAHRAGLVHRDLKPANMMFTGSGVKLLDFGLAMPAAAKTGNFDLTQSPTLAEPLTAAGAIVGTFNYMAPEQLEGREADARTDVFAMGCVLFEMATGRRPFSGTDGAALLGSILRDRPQAPSHVNPAMPHGLDPIVARCLEKDSAKRYASAAELGEEFSRLRRWAREEALPELAQMCERILPMEESSDSWNAFCRAREVEKLSPGDPMLERLRPEFSLPVTIESSPSGAAVFACFYGEPDGEWVPFGVTPLVAIQYPRGLTRLRLEFPGHLAAHDIFWNLSKTMNNAMDEPTSTWRYTLHPPAELPAEMEAVPAGAFPIFLPGLDHLEPEPTKAFLVDRHPVTNREYKRFVDAGGYAREEYWQEPFEDAGHAQPRAKAMARLTDSVGHPGPASWEMADFPAGEDNHPVTGISWYEAAAYAAWAGKSLPTLFHWNRVAFTFCNSQIVPLANFAGRGTVPVGGTRSENRFGVHDLAGNVREWVRNPVDRSAERFILGGGWNDPGYAFADAYAQPAFDRSLSNGFRCIRALEPDPNQAALERRIQIPFRDFRAEPTVSDEVFAFFLRQFHYDKSPLKEVLISDQASPLGQWQTVEIDAAYGAERMQLHVFLPFLGRPPYQTVIVFPGSNALHTRSFSTYEVRRLDFLLKGGRALVLPVYKSTYERGDGFTSDYPSETATYKDHVIMYAKDLSRAIDYVETRPDLDSGRIAYYGASWGGMMGAIMPAVEKRIKANILYVAGFCFQKSLPEVDQIHFASRVTQPTLMLNGELDFFFPAETSQKPMFERLGTPPEHKKRLTYTRGHTVPKVEMIKESLAWLDKYLGAVE